jgi:hypothetical protein
VKRFSCPMRVLGPAKAKVTFTRAATYHECFKS